MVPFFDVEALSDQVIAALARPDDYRDTRNKAREHVVEHYDVRRVCLPRMMQLFF
jgi:hypothetical protein